MRQRPIGFFVHHQGRGHAKRCEAILEHLGDRPIAVFCARPGLFPALDDRVRLVELPDAIGDPSQTAALHDYATPAALHCVPLGSRRLRRNAGMIARFFEEDDPSLFFVDVSAEWALLARLASVPAVKVRMHGDRDDPGHQAAYQACVAMVAPFTERLEQDDYPAWARAKTFYSGGLCTTTAAVLSRQEARRKLGLDSARQVIVVIAGGGGSGTPYAPLTMAARALPEALWLAVGPLAREGHETDFANLQPLGWVANPTDYLAAADLVVASAGDNTVHEIARIGRPFLCVPEWRYFNEQTRKARELARLGAAHTLALWPGSLAEWRDAVEAAMALDLEAQRRLFDPQAAANIADFLIGLEERLWFGAERPNALPMPLRPAVALAG